MKRNYADYVQNFEKCDIDASTFTHEDHVGVAYEMLRTYDFLTALMKYATCINTIATRAGAAQKYNTTITQAFMSIIAERMAHAEYGDYPSFIRQNSDLLERNVLEQWYSKERLQQDLARTSFLMPDRAAVAAMI